jgi:homoserine dehydrogenase
MSVTSMPFAVVGLGNIGRRLLELITRQRGLLAARYGLDFNLVAAADSTGAAVAPAGLEMSTVVQIKLNGQGIASYPGAGTRGMTAERMLDRSEMRLMVELSPVNLKSGEPGLGCIRLALQRGIPSVTANKGPLVLAYHELMSLAEERGTRLLFSGTVAGALPVVNIGVRDLGGCTVERVEGIFNTTTNYILCRMADEGIPFGEALAGAQGAGVAERDPSLDIDGWDAANKLVIVANCVLNRPTRLSDLRVEGIRGITRERLLRAREQGMALKLLATAVREGDDYRMDVRPTLLPHTHPLARVGLWDMGVIYYTDTMGTLTAIIEEKGAMPTAAAVLRDMINIFKFK